MNITSSPSTIARETLRQLATLRMAPTPDNYQKLYDEIAGIVTHKKLDNLPSEPVIVWGETITTLLKQLEITHRNLTLVKKREGVNRVLARFNTDPMQLHSKLLALIASWAILASTDKQSAEIEVIGNLSSTISTDDTDLESSITDQETSLQNNVAENYSDQLKTLLAEILEHIATLRLGDTALVDEAGSLANQVRLINDKNELTQFIFGFKQFSIKLKSCGDNGAMLQQRLLQLFNLLVDSTGELLADEQWLQNQIVMLRETMSNQLNIQVIEQAEDNLKEIRNKQDLIRRNFNDAKATLKQMASSLVDNLEELSESTGDYHDKIENYSVEINQTEDVAELNQLLVKILKETKGMQESVLSSRNDLLAARTEVDIAQSKISHLESELSQMGEKVHEDHLTGSLNRRGLDNAFERESARAKRQGQSMCLALLDIDNFKLLNDSHGHKVGDDALIYLVNAIKETTRPQDIVARFGGEEFVVLLPDANIEEAVSVISRVRRILTKQFFLHDNKRLLITFSAGIAEYQLEDSQESVIVRADGALYKAKNNGKNQIIVA